MMVVMRQCGTDGATNTVYENCMHAAAKEKTECIIASKLLVRQRRFAVVHVRNNRKIANALNRDRTPLFEVFDAIHLTLARSLVLSRRLLRRYA